MKYLSLIHRWAQTNKTSYLDCILFGKHLTSIETKRYRPLPPMTAALEINSRLLLIVFVDTETLVMGWEVFSKVLLKFVLPYCNRSIFLSRMTVCLQKGRYVTVERVGL